jgi:hypothetical protein
VYPLPPHCPYGVLVPVEVGEVVVLEVLVDVLVVIVSVVEVVVPDVFVLVEVVLVVVAVAVADGTLPLG